MKNNSAAIFLNLLKKHLDALKTYKHVALYYGVSESAVKSWMNRSRVPGLKTLEKIANHIGCKPHELIEATNQVSNHFMINREIHAVFAENLKILFVKNQAFQTNQKLALLHHCVTDFALSSYLRSNYYRSPTLEGLDKIADALHIPTYLLLKERESG